MATSRKIEVIGAFKPFLRMLGVYNSENFHHLHQRKIRLNICRVSCIATFTAMQILMCSLLFWFWADENFSLSSRVVSTCMCGVQMTAINISMKLNNRKIAELIDHTEMAVKSRNSKFSYKNCFICLHHIECFIARGGLMRSSSFAKLTNTIQYCLFTISGLEHRFQYKKLEKKHYFFTFAAYKWSMIACVSIFIVSATLPISYIIFNQPLPEKWILPVQTQ